MKHQEGKDMLKKKNWKTGVLLAVGLMLLTGCGQGSGENSASGAETQAAASGESVSSDTMAGEAAAEDTDGDLLSRIRERGQLIVAMEGTWSPWTYHDENDVLTGYDVDVAKGIAQSIGVEPVFVEGEWDGLFAGLDAGRYDLVINGVDITPEREGKYDFSEPYAYNRTAIIVNGDNDDIHSFEDLKGKNTANTITSTYAELAESYGANVTGVDDLNQTFELLRSGRIDATLNAELTYYDYMKAHPDADMKIAALTDTASEVAIPMRKGAETESLRAAVNEAIDSMRASGELSEISQQYFGSDISDAPSKN